MTSNSKASFVSAVVQSNSGQTDLMLVPFEKSDIRTVIKNNTTVYIVSRYEDLRGAMWFNVVYESPVTTVVGWLPSAVLSDLKVNGQSIEPLDIPITEFELNKKDDFNSASGHALRQYSLKVLLPLLACFLVVPIALAFVGVEIGTAFMGSLGLGLVIIGFLGTKGNGFRTMREMNTMTNIRKSLRSDYERMRDDQRENMALNAALQLGTNVITRQVASKQDITVRRR